MAGTGSNGRGLVQADGAGGAVSKRDAVVRSQMVVSDALVGILNRSQKFVSLGVAPERGVAAVYGMLLENPKAVADVLWKREVKSVRELKDEVTELISIVGGVVKLIFEANSVVPGATGTELL